jgi:hypothetical protein
MTCGAGEEWGRGTDVWLSRPLRRVKLLARHPRLAGTVRLDSKDSQVIHDVKSYSGMVPLRYLLLACLACYPRKEQGAVS